MPNVVTSTEHFTEAELACRCGSCEPGMDRTFMHTLERIRRRYGKPMKVSSAYRCPEYNQQVSSTGATGPHTTRRAVDILVVGANTHTLINIALAEGITGLGLQQKGPQSARFLHLDDLPNSPGTPRPWVWTY